MKDERYLLALFLKSINNINKKSDFDTFYTSTSSLYNLFKYNNKNLMKYLKSNIDLTDKDIKVNDIDKKK